MVTAEHRFNSPKDTIFKSIDQPYSEQLISMKQREDIPLKSVKSMCSEKGYRVAAARPKHKEGDDTRDDTARRATQT